MSFYQFIIYLAEHDHAGILFGIFVLFFVFALTLESLVETRSERLAARNDDCEAVLPEQTR